jgi:hypothetical protein
MQQHLHGFWRKCRLVEYEISNIKFAGTGMKKFAAKMRAFLRSERGNIAMMFAVALVPLMIGAGVGLDFARAIRSSGRSPMCAW